MRFVILIVVLGPYLNGCAIGQIASTTYGRPTDGVRTNVKPLTQSSLIWRGNANGVTVEWTSNDVIIEPTNGRRFGLIERSVEELHKAGIKNAKAAFQEIPKPKGNLKVVTMGNIRILSAVGPIVSFEIRHGGWVEGYSTSGELNWITLDFSKKPENVLLFDDSNGFASEHPQELVLSDIFGKSTIVRALLDNSQIKQSLKGNSKVRQIQIIEDAVENGSILKIDDDGFALNGFSGFVFHNIQNDSVLIRLQVYQMAAATKEARYLEIRLPIPPRLRTDLEQSSSLKSGFLNKDLEHISGNRLGETKFETDISVKE